MVEVEAILNSRPLTNVADRLGRAVETSPGRDGEVRVAKVKTAYGSFVRPVAGLARVFSPQFFNSNFSLRS